MGRVPVIDSDGHVMENSINWQEVLPAELREKGGFAIRTYNRPYFPEPIVRGTEGRMGEWHSAPERKGMWVPEKRIKDMDLEGIDIAVLFGGGTGLGVSGLRDRQLARAMAKAYNDWLASYCQPFGERLKGVAAVPLQDVDAAIEELHRCVLDYGFVAASIPVNIDGKPLDSKDYYPFYEAAQKLDVPICIHNTIVIDGPGGERFTSFVRKKAILDPIEMFIASMSLILGGVFDDFPQLRFAFMESGVGWVPYWMDRLDEYYEEFREHPLRHNPGDYFRGSQCYVSCEVEEKTLAYAVQATGEDRILFASDYLHHDCKFPKSVASIADREDLSTKAKAKILGGNALQLFGLDKTA